MKTLKLTLILTVLLSISSFSIVAQSNDNKNTKTQTSTGKPQPSQAEITADSIAATDSFSVADVTPTVVSIKNLDEIQQIQKKSNFGGTIHLKALINRKGLPLKVMVMKMDQELEIVKNLFIEGIMGSTFKPAELKGKPVPSWVQLAFKFDPKSANSAMMDSRINKK